MNLLGVTTLDQFGLLKPIRQLINDSSPGSPRCNAVIKDTQRQQFTAALQAEFTELFKDGLGHCTKAKESLVLKPNATPVFRRARPVPYAARAEVESELDRLIDLGVIKPIEHTNWAAPIVMLKKPNGKSRLCVDYSTGLNDALELNKHPLPLPDDIFTTLNGGKIFSILDLSDAYLQVELDDASKQLCCISTHRGNYAYQQILGIIFLRLFLIWSGRVT